jgi:hypothetical protein
MVLIVVWNGNKKTIIGCQLNSSRALAVSTCLMDSCFTDCGFVSSASLAFASTFFSKYFFTISYPRMIVLPKTHTATALTCR